MLVFSNLYVVYRYMSLHGPPLSLNCVMDVDSLFWEVLNQVFLIS